MQLYDDFPDKYSQRIKKKKTMLTGSTGYIQELCPLHLNYKLILIQLYEEKGIKMSSC